MELKRLNSYRLGLVYFLASLMCLIDPEGEAPELKQEACYEALASLIPPELTLAKDNLQSTVQQIKMFQARLAEKVPNESMKTNRRTKRANLI